MSSASLNSVPGPARRTVVAAVGAAGLAAALTACGDSDDSASTTTGVTGGAAGAGTAGAGTTGTTGDAGTAGTAGAGGAAPLAKTTDIPEGGGKVFEAQKIVVVQPSAGQFKAFSSVCTHQGCAVKSVTDGVINCPCHNSNFSAADGSVKSGPAQKPLPEVKIAVNGDSITLA